MRVNPSHPLLRDFSYRAAGSIAVVAALLLGACGQPESEPLRETGAAPVPTVTIAPVRMVPSGRPIATSGRLTFDEEIELSFFAGGIVESVMVDAGDAVASGQVLARLDQSRLTADLEAARTERALAARQVERLSRLLGDSVATLEAVEQARTALEVALAREQGASLDVDRAVIRAPHAGRILQRFVDPSETVGPGRPAFVVGTGGSGWRIRTEVTGRDAVRLHPGDSAAVIVDALGDRRLAGRVTDVAFAANPANGMFEVEVALSDRSGQLRPGLAVRVAIFASGSSPVYSLPIEALAAVRSGEGWVYVAGADPGTGATVIHRVAVKVEAVTADGVLASSEVPLDAVVVGGVDALSDGEVVSIRQSAE